MRIVLPTRAKRTPSVTVVVPCYNYGHYLPQIVASVLTQARVDARVVIVDDASPDGSVEVARRLSATDSRIEVIAHEVNAGHIQTYNDGLATVTTDYVSLVSADDIVAPGALGRATSLMEAHPRVGLVHGKAVPFSTEADRIPHGLTFLDVRTVWSGREWIEYAARGGRNPILSPEAVMRTTALKQVGVYNSELPHAGDLEYWIRTAARWDVGWIRGPVQAYYRVHGANMHLTDFAGEAANLRQLLLAFASLDYPDIVAELPDGPRLHDMARATIARRAMKTAAVASDSEHDDALSAELIELAHSAHPEVATSWRPESDRK